MACVGLVIALLCAMDPAEVRADEEQAVAAQENPTVAAQENPTVAAQESSENQTITAEEFDEVFDAMRDSDWSKANALAEKLISRDSPAQRYLLARIRYLYIYTLVAQFEKDSVSIQDLTYKISDLKGKMILQPWHPIKAKDEECRNMICNDPQWDDVLCTTQTNRDKTKIFWYEYVNTGKHLDLSSYSGKMARMGGTLKDFSINEDLMVTVRSEVDWFLRMEVVDGFIQYNR